MCNGRQDCPLGDDEEACTEFYCDGLFKCMKTDVQLCVHYSEICDRFVDCPLADDELFCDISNCPLTCQCLMTAISLNILTIHGIQ